MTGASHNDQDFIQRLRSIIEANLQNEQFGIDKLTKEMNMSRSYLHRTLKKQINQNISHFIRVIRLENAMKMLLNSNESVAEIAYRVGFGSPAYFNHCFHDYYGFPPGEARRRVIREDNTPALQGAAKTLTNRTILTDYYVGHKKSILKSGGIIFTVAFLIFSPLFLSEPPTPKLISRNNAIVVLPFKNLTADPNNQYLADGLLEDILNNLNQLTALRVVSRTSAERFRDSILSVQRIAELMHVNYVLEGSIRRYGNKTRINIQLIDAGSDNQLWSECYNNELGDVMEVQSEVASQVAHSLNAVMLDSEYTKNNSRSRKKRGAYGKD